MRLTFLLSLAVIFGIAAGTARWGVAILASVFLSLMVSAVSHDLAKADHHP